jgi:hypothetical protein
MAAQFNVVFVPGTTWQDTDVVDAGKLNQGDAGGAWTVTGATTNLTDFSTSAPAEGQFLVYRVATGKWGPEALPVSANDTFNRIFTWAHFV